jgi:hypothetical protein
MNWIMITCFAVFFMIFVILYFINEENHADSTLGMIWEGICCIFTASFGGLFFGGLLAAFICDIGRRDLEREERVYQSYNLVALDTNEDINGSYSNMFFVGSGRIGEDLYYHFYYDTPQGIKYKKVMVEDCFIIETGEKPSYKIYGEYYKKVESVFYEVGIIEETREVLYIPKGTIKSNYKVN